MVQITESDYRTAQNGNAEVRQEFLNAVDLEDAREFVKRVKYLPKETGLMACAPNYSHLRGWWSGNLKVIGKSQIEVYPRSFSFSCPLFLSAMIDHEGYHARQQVQNSSGFETIVNALTNQLRGSWKEIYLRTLLELPAYYNQIAKKDERGLSLDETNYIEKFAESYLKVIMALQKQKLASPIKDLQRILCDSEGDQLIKEKVLPILNFGGRN